MLETRGWISLILGIITTLAGAIPLVFSLGWIGWNLPYSPIGTILYIILILGGVFLLFDSVHEDHHMKTITIILGLLLIVVGVLPLLFKFGVVGFDISSYLTVDIIKNILMIAGGVFLIFGSGD